MDPSSPSLRLATEARGKIKRHRQVASGRQYQSPAETTEEWLDWYLRISKDAEQRGLGVKRQRGDGYAMADRLGIPRERVRFHRDNDISGADFTDRDAYDELLEGVGAGTVKIIGASETSRLAREPLEKEELLLIAELHGVRLVTTDGDDLRPDADDVDDKLMFSRIKGAVDKVEQAKIRRRVRKKHLEIAKAGRPSGGGPRAFGYEADGVTIDEDEAALIREGVARLLSGEKLHTIAKDWRERGVTTPGHNRCVRDDEGLIVDRVFVPGKAWLDTPLRRVLSSYRIAGWRVHHGEPVARATWPAIVSKEQVDAVRAIFANPARRTNAGRSSVYLLAGGFGRCGECGANLIGKPNNGKPAYRCPPADRGGCAGVYVQANFLEREVQDRFFAALNDEAMMLAWRDAEADDVDRAKVLDDIDADEAQLDVLADALGNREMTPARYKDQVAKVNARLAANRRLLRTAEGPAAMVAVEGGVDRLMERWSSMPMGQRRAKLMCAMDHFTVKRTAVKGSKKFDPERVAVQWFDAAP